MRAMAASLWRRRVEADRGDRPLLGDLQQLLHSVRAVDVDLQAEVARLLDSQGVQAGLVGARHPDGLLLELGMPAALMAIEGDAHGSTAPQVEPPASGGEDGERSVGLVPADR